MNATYKILIAAIATIILQSCNMSRHYANMRIDHDDEALENAKPQENVKTTYTQCATEKITTDTISAKSAQQEAQHASFTKISNKHSESITQQTKFVKTATKPVYYAHVKKKNVFTVHKIKRKIRKHKISATNDLDDWFGFGVVIALIIGLLVAIVSGSIGAGFLTALGIVLLVMLGIAIAIAAIIWFIFELLFATIWN